MKVVELQRVVPDYLLSARFEGQELDEFDRLTTEWADVEFLRDYFKRNENEITLGFYADIGSVDNAIRITIAEAADFADQLVACADGNPSLEDIFRPLHRGSVSAIREHSKAYGTRKRSWLRIYAIRVTGDYYAISGGGIKLTRAMQEAEGLEYEIAKLNCLAQFLKEQGLEDPSDYCYIDFDLQ